MSSPIPRARAPMEQRESLLRASILDTALELGIGTNSTVANWMFNPVPEGDEDTEDTLSPSLTYASTATSEEYSLSPSFASRHARPGASSAGQFSPQRKASTPVEDAARVKYTQQDGLTTRGLTPEAQSQRTIHFDLSATPEPRAPSPLPPVTSKLRKLRKAKPDGYESDGGYVSDGPKSGKDTKKTKKKKDKHGGSDDESDGGYLSDILHKRRNKKIKKEKARLAEAAAGAATDYETDGGSVPVVSMGRGKKEKKSKSSVPAGDESDGGNLSESSTKKRRFFRLNSRSRKRGDSDLSPQEVIPPVPSLPPLPLPIAERFARSETPSFMDSSRTTTPALTDHTATQRSSDDVSFLDTTSSLSSPMDSPRGLTTAFRDAESIRTPSTDVLRAFGRQGALSALQSPTRTTPQSREEPDATQAPSMSSLHGIPTLGLPKPKRNPSQKRTPAQISAPNTRSLSAKPHPPPMTLVPPTPTATTSPLRLSPRSPNPETGSTLIVAQPTTPTSSIYDSVPQSPAAASDYSYTSPAPDAGTGSVTNAPQVVVVRPHALAKYDLPPPSPPPARPLPQVPPTPTSPDATSSSSSWRLKPFSNRPTTVDSERRPPASPLAKSSSDGGIRPGTAPAQAPPSPYRPAASPLRSMTAPSSAPAMIRSASSPTNAAPPLFLQRKPSIQRGRELPFPSRPVFNRTVGGSTDTVDRIPYSRPDVPVSVSGSMYSSSGVSIRGDELAQQQSDAAWQPRSSSEATQPQQPEREASDHSDDDDDSWMDFGDGSRRASRHSVRSSMESHPDIESVLSALQDGQDDEDVTGLYADRSGDEFDDDDRSRYTDEERGTRYFEADADGDSDTEGHGRYSMWSAADRRSRASILDDERSGDASEKLAKRVAAIYSKEGIAQGLVPPVPTLPLAPKRRMR